ncbi:MAG: hypothetical protein ACLQB4_11925, partial [Beijerinckiaceae bacterium]
LLPPALGTPAALRHNHTPRSTIPLFRERRRPPLANAVYTGTSRRWRYADLAAPTRARDVVEERRPGDRSNISPIA